MVRWHAPRGGPQSCPIREERGTTQRPSIHDGSGSEWEIFRDESKSGDANKVKYSGKENAHLERSVDTNIASLVQLLESKYISTATEYKPVDFAPKAQFFTLDVISELAFGKPLGNLENDEDLSSYIKAMEATFPMLVLVGAFPWLAKLFFMRPFRSLLPSDTDAVGMGKLMGFVLCLTYSQHHSDQPNF